MSIPRYCIILIKMMSKKRFLSSNYFLSDLVKWYCFKLCLPGFIFSVFLNETDILPHNAEPKWRELLRTYYSFMKFFQLLRSSISVCFYCNFFVCLVEIRFESLTLVIFYGLPTKYLIKLISTKEHNQSI